jgi:nucleoside-diphosphate-sugar epimerase
MRVFVTGATGFIGFAIVKELLGAGHQVIGLARSEESGRKLAAAGAEVHLGTVEDLDGLRRAASKANGAIHTAFYHKISHIPLGARLGVMLGGAPSGIVQRFLKAAVTTDRQTIETIAESLNGADRPLVAAFGTLAMRQGTLAGEDDACDPNFVGAARAKNEDVLKGLAVAGIRTSAMRLPPIVHGPGDHGFAELLIKTARKKKESGYVGDGSNRWPSVHRDDAARAFRLALESGVAGRAYHAVAEEGIPFGEIAGLIGKRLNVPVVSMTQEQAVKHFSFIGPFVGRDNPTSSRLTQERLGWRPVQAGLLADLDQAGYFTA